MSEVYATRRITRIRRTKAAVEQLDRQILEVLRADNPQSVRHVFYRMTNPRLREPVEKSDHGYEQVQHRCTELRRSGLLPYRFLTDASRRGYFTPTFGSAGDFLSSVVGHYRADVWADADVYCEVWVESRSLAGVIEADCAELAVSLYPAAGFSSISLVYQAAEDINAGNRGRPVRIFYIGDYDPAGVLIDVSLEEELRRHVSAEIELDFERIAITEAQIADLDLPTKPRKPGDRRSLHVKATVEAEAMPAANMRALLRTHVEALLPRGALRVAKASEKSERAHIERMAALMERRP